MARRARKNMAFRVKDPATGAVYEADTIEEFQQLQALFSDMAPAKRAPRSATRRTRAPSTRSTKPRKVKDPTAMISYGQAKSIGNSLGGFQMYCPTAFKSPDKVSHQQVLSAAGLTMGQANVIIDALKQAGLFGFNRDPMRVAEAQAIFTRASGFRCPIPAPQSAVAAKNPRATYTVMWSHSSGKKGKVMGLPGSESIGFSRHKDHTGKYEPLQMVKARVGKHVGQIRRMGFKDILVLNSKGDEVPMNQFTQAWKSVSAKGIRVNPSRKPPYANWTSDPEYSYDQFYRANPKKLKASRGKWKHVGSAPDLGDGDIGDKWKTPSGQELWVYESGGEAFLSGPGASVVSMDFPPTHVRKAMKARSTQSGVFSHLDKFYRANPKAKGNRSGRGESPRSKYLKPSTRSWPVGDLQHAEIALQYMTAGRGNRSEYPKYIRQMAKIWPVDEQPHLWYMYDRNRKNIAQMAGKAVPTLKQLGGSNSRQNPKLAPSPFIGKASYYEQPANAGFYTPETFPYGQAGRPAVYKVGKKNPRQAAPWVGVAADQYGEAYKGFETKSAALKWAGGDEDDVLKGPLDVGTGWLGIGQEAHMPYEETGTFYGKANPNELQRLIQLTSPAAARKNGRLTGTRATYPPEFGSGLSHIEWTLTEAGGTSQKGLIDYIKWTSSNKPKQIGWTEAHRKKMLSLAKAEASRRSKRPGSMIAKSTGKYGYRLLTKSQARMAAATSAIRASEKREKKPVKLAPWQREADKLGIDRHFRKKVDVMRDIAAAKM